MEFLSELYSRNPALTLFGWICLFSALITIALIFKSKTEILGINAWIKPSKFLISTVLFVWTIGWYMHYLPEQSHVGIFSWITILIMSFELIYITYQAGIGQTSHFNVSSSFNATMWSLMGSLIGLMTLYLAFIGFLFFKNSFSELPLAYVWAIRLGIVLFVIFAFEGYIMGSKMSHTVGASDGSTGIPFFNWSVEYGDLRIAHFVGMHALQVLPILAFYLLKDFKLILLISFIYGSFAVFILIIALKGKSIFRSFS